MTLFQFIVEFGVWPGIDNLHTAFFFTIFILFHVLETSYRFTIDASVREIKMVKSYMTSVMKFKILMIISNILKS